MLLNGLIFILIGLQLPSVVNAIQGQSVGQLVTYGFGISLAVVAIRFAFVFMADTLSNEVRKRLRLPPIFPSRRHTTLLAYISMRGIVSLAAVLSIPERLPDGTPFPGRNLILFITFCVILFTLVGPGITVARRHPNARVWAANHRLPVPAGGEKTTVATGTGAGSAIDWSGEADWAQPCRPLLTSIRSGYGNWTVPIRQPG